MKDAIQILCQMVLCGLLVLALFVLIAVLLGSLSFVWGLLTGWISKKK